MKKLVLFLAISVTITLNVNASIGDTVYVNQSASGANDGTSWTDAYQELYSATNIAGSTQQIWVAAGTYKPDPSSRGNAFTPHCNMYGGFNGSETQLSQRDWVANPTILSGDRGVLGDNTDNSESIIKIQSVNTGVGIEIDGFTISDGYADGNYNAQRYGGGIYVRNFSDPLTIRNCIIKNNYAVYTGGLYYTADNHAAVSTTSITIENTRFTNNHARYATAFSVTAADTITVNATIVNCLIDNNETKYFTGAAGFGPGGRFLQTTSGQINGRIINCTFAGNIDNSTVPDSSKSVFLTQIDNSNPVNNIEIHNTIFYGNTINPNYTSIGYGTSTSYKPTNVTIYNTITEDVLSNIDFVTSTNNTQVDPLFTNPAAGDFTLQSTSPAINTGDTTGISNFIPALDLNENSRYVGISIDLGCYEYQLATNINEQTNQNNLTVYPNPATTKLSIDNGALKINTITIIDLTGKTVKTIVPTNNTIDVSNLIKGIYFIQMQTEKGIMNSKFIKE